jgi:hypothetical protein
MEEISILLREARPLYRTRKRRQKIAVCGASLAVGLWALMLPFQTRQALPLYDDWSDELYLTENGSPIEELGFPVDDYGLLMVG